MTDSADKRVEDRLQMLSQVFQESADPIIILDLQGGILEMNLAAEQAFGFPREELIGKPVKTTVPPEYHDQTDSLLKRCREGENIRNVESLRWNRSHRAFPVLITLSLLCDAKKRPMSIATIFKDISKQKDIENELKQLTHVFRSILDNVTVCINSIDERGIFTASMGSGLKKMGLSENELIGKNVFEFFPHFQGDLKRVLEGDTIAVLDRGETNGEEWVFQHTFFPSEDGKKGMIDIGVDVSELRYLQRAVINISERERENIGRELHDELGQILTGVAYLVKALEEKITDRAVMDIADVQMISDLMGKAIDQTRTLARGLIPVQMQKGFLIALEELTSEIERLFGVAFRIRKNGIPELHDLTTATHLFYIVREALYNAVKHGGAREIEVELTSRGDNFIIVIRNAGDFTGMQPYDTKGLGLKIMKYRADIIGAYIETVADGTGFTVRIVRGEVLM